MPSRRPSSARSRLAAVSTATLLLAAAGATLALASSTASAAHATIARAPRSAAPKPPVAAERHAPTLSPFPPPANPFANARMHRFLASRSGNITAAVYDVKSNTTYLYHPGDREQTASIIKVDILATLLAQAQSRGSFINASQRAIATGMIEESDNDDATDLWQQEGGPSAVAAFNARLHMTQTTPNFAWGLTTTTPRDQLLLLRHVALPNDILRYPSRSYETYLMRHVIGLDYWGVTAGPRPGVSVAVKNGWLPVAAGWQVNSIGAIHGDGRDYLLAVMTNHEAEEGYGIDTIEGISSIVWSTFGARPATSTTGPSGPTATSGTARPNR